MNRPAVRIVIVCVTALTLSSCDSSGKFGSDLRKFGNNFGSLLQGQKAPAAKADKAARRRPVALRTAQPERDRQARIPTIVAIEDLAPEKARPVPEAKPRPARLAVFAVPLPRAAPRMAGPLPRPAPGRPGDAVAKTETKAQDGEAAEAIGYRGERRKGVAHGEGEWRSADGHRYAGAFRNGKFHGRGAYYWPDGERYEGDFREGQFHGTAIWSMANGDRYAGDVRDGKFHGKGAFSRQDGEHYEGDFRDGKFYGFGVWTMADGNRYVGDVRNDEFHGCGAYIWGNGEYYAGEFRHDRFHGLGSYAWPDGLMRTCEWRSDAEIEESCTEHVSDGGIPDRAAAACFRTAAWRSALPAPGGGGQAPGQDDGAGRREAARAGAQAPGSENREEARYEGQHRDGQPHGRGTLSFANGDRYVGEFADGQIRGRGTMYLANGDVYGGEGAFDSQGFQGCGLYVRANGDRYMGQFRDGRFHGRGTYEWAQGVAATCDWRDGERVVESCRAHRVTGIGARYRGDGVCGTLTAGNVKRHKRWGR